MTKANRANHGIFINAHVSQRSVSQNLMVELHVVELSQSGNARGFHLID